MKLISIIIPVYNVESYIRKCLDSVISQTYSNIEIILVDDGSQDSSCQICDEYAKIDARIKVIHKKNEGVALARFAGFENSSGDLITFIDSDDYVDSKYIEKLVAPFDKYNIDLSTCEYYEEKRGNLSHAKRSVHGYLMRKDIDEMISERYLIDKKLNHAGLPIFLWSKMIKREFVRDALLQGIGLYYGEDTIATFHVLTHVMAIVALPDPLYYYVQHDGQITRCYNTNLWYNQFECWQRHKALDYNNLLKYQLPLRMWWVTKQNFIKMVRANITFGEFQNDMKLLEKNKTWIELLRNKSIYKGRYNKMALLLIRYKLYYPLYIILKYFYGHC